MKKFIAPLALLTVAVSFVYFTAFSRQKGEPVNFVREVRTAVPEEDFQKKVDVVEVQEYGYGRAPLGHPVFEFGSIKLKSGGIGKCGAVTLVPYPGLEVLVRSRRFKKNWRGQEPQPEKKLLSADWVEVDPSGLRVKYDRAGGSQDYYKIFCRIQDQGNTRPVDCRRVLTIQSVKQGHCAWGPGGVDAGYAPLNMSVKN